MLSISEQYINPIFQMAFPGIYVEESECHNDSYVMKRHSHDTTEFYFMVSGERYYFVESESFHVKPGMVVLIRPNQIHKTNMVTGEGYHRFLLQLDTATTDLFMKLAGSNALEAKPYDVISFLPQDWQVVLSTFEQLKLEMQRETSKEFTMSRILVMQLVALVMQAQKQQNLFVSDTNAPDRCVHIGMYEKVHDIILYIQQHSSEECSLNEIAAHFFISRSYLTRIFKTVTGITIKEYLTLCRIRKAMSLLNSTDLNITEIASRTGFGSITNFEKHFKEATDTTPLQYRKMQKVFLRS